MEPTHGNHFGFCEGSLLDIRSNTTTYAYPAKVAGLFMELILASKFEEKSFDVSSIAKNADVVVDINEASTVDDENRVTDSAAKYMKEFIISENFVA